MKTVLAKDVVPGDIFTWPSSWSFTFGNPDHGYVRAALGVIRCDDGTVLIQYLTRDGNVRAWRYDNLTVLNLPFDANEE